MGTLLGGALLTLCAPAPCAAEVRTLRVVDDGHMLREALETSLSSWGVRVTAAADGAPPDAEVVLSACAEELCLRLRVHAPPLDQSWTVPATQLDPETAAALALGIKARLRNGAALPPRPATADEPAAQTAQEAELAAVAAAPDTPAPAVQPAPSPASPARPAADVSSPQVSTPRSPQALPALRFALGAGLLAAPLDAGGALPRLEGGVSVMPWRHGGLSLGASLDGAAHLPRTVRSSGVRASFSASELTAGLRGLYTLGPRITLDVTAHAGVLFTHIDGQRASTGERFDTTRRAALLGGALGLSIALSRRWALAPRVTVDARPRTLRYLIADAPVWELTRVGVSGALRLEVRP
jgi:hypothetical protein